MPAFIAVLERDHSPSDPMLLDRLANALALVAPRSQRSSIDEQFGWVCGRTNVDGTSAQHAFANGVHIVAWSRLHERRTLIESLSSAPTASDVELILDGYARWGPDVLSHIIGDFAFALWDPRTGCLLAATDQFGVRPLFFASVEGRIIVSNMLAAIRDSGCVTRELDEQVVGDTLSLGFSTDQNATIYSSIRRLPPGHRLIGSSGHARVERYWHVPRGNAPLLYQSYTDYAEHFRELLVQAVADRTPSGGPIGVLLSGGMDSTSVAAATRIALGPRETSRRVTGYTTVYRDFPENEGQLAALVTGHLEIGSKSVVAEDFHFRALPEHPRWVSPQPDPIAALIPEFEVALEVAGAQGALFTGLGGDVLLGGGGPFLADAIRAAGWRAPLMLLRHFRLFHRLPHTGLRRAIGRRIHRLPSFEPLWIDTRFSRRTHLTSRLERYRANASRGGLERLVDPFWSHLLAMGDPGQTGLVLEQAHPFFDTRLVDFCSRLPAALLAQKRVLREAMAPFLPASIVTRPKTPLGYASLASRRHPRVAARHDALLHRVPQLEAYVNIEALRRCIASPQVETAHGLCWAENFAFWLKAVTESDVVPIRC